MKQLKLNDLKVELNFKQIFYFDSELRYEYSEDGKRTDKIVGSRVDVFGLTADGVRKVFSVNTEEVLDAEAFKVGEKIVIHNPQISAWFDRGTNYQKFAVKATKITAV